MSFVRSKNSKRPRRVWRIFKRCLLAGVLLVTVNLAAGDCRAQTEDTSDVIRVNTDLVIFDAQVINKKTKHAVSDLKKEDFGIVEAGVKQQIGYFSRDELPLSIMLVLDVSRSVRPILQEIRDGALNALQQLKSQDEVAVLAFANRPELVQDFTRDRKLVAEKIKEATGTDHLGPGTFLDQALLKAITRVQHASSPSSRRVIIVVTDNIAPHNKALQKEVLAGLSDTGTVVYGLIVRAAIGKVFNVMFLGLIRGVNEYVDETGGEMLGAGKTEVEARLAEIIDRLRARYTLGFKPTNTTEDGKFRRVEIKVTPGNKPDKNLVLVTKRGYYLRRRAN